ncbi:histidine kinase [Ramlibacter sp. USB13]|uniref:Histidine kinase n=1 Tax=Ramlibacter cellulosilyticus TaxID=2764187 RepID=A0A923S9U9_9BURK|nr:histidine kinase [Ramlibacter cellulosilyticus]MBC5782139.1 histidine kinase [Ramlibacter cellulosilyticus]
MRIEAIDKLQHYLQTLAFCLMVSTIEQAFNPRALYGPSVVYSILIGTTIWAVVDLGRHLLPSARETGWPDGFAGIALVAVGIVAGFFVGSAVGDVLCRAWNLYPAGQRHDPEDHLRTGMMITLLAGIVGSYWFYSRNRSAYLLRKMGEAQKHAHEARLKLLETQLEPHMLFNTLANLRALIGVDPPRAQHMLDHMIAYLRATLDASRNTTHPLQAEFDRLRDYLELMAIRMGPRLAYTLDLPPELASVRVPTLLLQPLVENSIQHGLEPKVEGGRIAVRAARESDRLVLTVDDTGVGRASGASNGSGFGLSQVRERLAALHAGDAALDFRAADDGAHARIALPIA